MNTPTSSAPHIWWKLRRNTSPTWAALRRPKANSSSTTTIHEVRIAVPAMKGVKLNTAVTLGLAALQAATSAEQPTACALKRLTFGSVDQGPVQAATTTRSTTKGSHACATSPGLSPCDWVWRADRKSV